ncbi:MAG: hypothetical protein ACRDS1_10930 [Pseudonocardiaceae bacterium]
MVAGLDFVPKRPPRSGMLPEQAGLHRDGVNVVVDIHDRRVQLRNPDVDYVVIRCAAPAPTGGQSLLVDGYRLVERINAHDGTRTTYVLRCKSEEAW